ncbi:MAG TPA: NUDIX hydrolase [Myxococcota bacterium]|nr:NUDIX hydrolase [Myxococcota bacterium]HRY92151.1 NUDIX hydrolase [Myxococcota bacterium]
MLERPVLAVDVALFGLGAEGLMVLLHPRREAPFRGARALPGVALQADESLLDGARRALASKAGLPAAAGAGVHLEQLATFDGLYRDPRGRTVSVVYLGLCRAPLPTPARGAAFTALREVTPGGLPFDHAQVLEAALVRLRGKLRYTNLAAFLLPEAFRLEELQRVYEAILGRRLNRANFRTKLLRIGLLERCGVVRDAPGEQGGRPPHLYRFTRGDLEAEDRDFL